MIDIEYYTSEATTLLNSLIGIPSLSREEEAAADFLRPQQTDYFTKFPHRYRKTGKRMAETSFHSESRKRKDLRFGK